MHKFSLIILLVFGICFFASAQSEADKRYRSFGLYNGYFKQVDEHKARPFSTFRPQDTIRTHLTDHQLSFGLFWRKELPADFYRQIDILEINWSEFSNGQVLYGPFYTGGDVLSGEETSSLSFRSAYQVGKLFALLPGLYGDAGIRLSAWYERRNVSPLQSTGFNQQFTSLGSGLNLELGLFYRLGDHLQLGYHFIPVAATAYWQKTHYDNPILTKDQQYDYSMELGGHAFEALLDFRNIHLSYIF